MNRKNSLFLLALVTAASFLNADPIVYKVDPVHSGVSFKVRHFLNKIPGSFAKFEGEIHFDPETPANSKAVGTVYVSSIDTRNDKRDEHLQSKDYFDAANNPAITFASTSWTPTGKDTYSVTGVLSMAGADHPIVLELTYLGEMEARGRMRSGWEATATIDRTVWGIESGAPAVGNEVEIELNIQAHRE